MRRLAVGLMLLATVLGVGWDVARAQEATPTAGHPLVGLWIIVNDIAPGSTPSVGVFTADGTYVENSGDDTVNVGTWSATGPNTAVLTTVSGESEGDAFDGFSIIRAEIEVSPDGSTFDAKYTIELIDPSGDSSGQAGPATAKGSRVGVEGPGTPVLSVDELIASLAAESAATPTP